MLTCIPVHSNRSHFLFMQPIRLLYEVPLLTIVQRIILFYGAYGCLMGFVNCPALCNNRCKMMLLPVLFYLFMAMAEG